MAYEDNLCDFIDHYKGILDAKQNGEDGMAKEFMTVKTQAGKFKQEEGSSAGEKACNIKKNRYKDILPFDSTRFVLKSAESSPEGYDYINASFIANVQITRMIRYPDSGTKEKHAYIAAQGPLQSTATDFWRLLWESGANIVIMACNEYELNKNKQRQLKCQRYWCEDSEEKEFGDITVTLIDSEIPHRDFKYRHLRAKKGKEEKTFHQFHYTAWPDHGVPDTVTSILDLVQRVRQLQPTEKKPIIVHCSAGCGRTGTILALDYVSELIKEKNVPSDFSLFNIIMTMRKQRPAIVQTKEQYEFVHKAVSELFKHELSSLGVDYGHNYENIQIGVLPTAQEKPRLPPGLQVPVPKPQKPQNSKPTPGKPPPSPVTSTRPVPFARPPAQVERPPAPVKPETSVYSNAEEVVQLKPLKHMAVKPRPASKHDIKEMEDIERTLAQPIVKKSEPPKASLKPSKSPLARVPSGRGNGGAPPPSKPSTPMQPLRPTGVEGNSLASIKDALNASHLGPRSPGGGSRPLFEPPKPPGKGKPPPKPIAQKLGKELNAKLGANNESAYEPVNIAPVKAEKHKKPQVAKPPDKNSQPSSLERQKSSKSRGVNEKALSPPDSSLGVLRRLSHSKDYEPVSESAQQHRRSDPVVSVKPKAENETKAKPASTTPLSESAYEEVPGNRQSTGDLKKPNNHQSPIPKKKMSASAWGSQGQASVEEEAIPVPPRTGESYVLVQPPGSGKPMPRPAAPHISAISKAVSGGRSITPSPVRGSLGSSENSNIPVIPERTAASYELVEIQPPEEDSSRKSSSSSKGGHTLARLAKLRPQLPNLPRMHGSSTAPKPPPVHPTQNGQRSESPMPNGQQRPPLAFPARLPKPNGPRPQPGRMRAEMGVIPS